MNKGLWKFVISVAIVISLVAAVDFIVGIVLNNVIVQISNQGDTGKTYFALNDVKAPVVIVGSSRAAHHYVSSMIEDSLGLETYNLGRDGCFFSYNCCVVNSILDRYAPSLIIWENGMNYLYENESDPLESLYPYYGSNNWVTNTISEELSWDEQAKLGSNFYKYNSILHRILIRYFMRSSFIDRTQKGYDPLISKQLNKPLDLTAEQITSSQISMTKTKRLEGILKRSQSMGVKIVMLDSPIYATLDKTNNESLQLLTDLCKKYDALFIDNTQLPYFLEHPEFFNDRTHINDLGATFYTQHVISQFSKWYKVKLKK